MGKKSSYFRHSFNAHKDTKIMELIQRGGVKTLGVYFVLLEIYGQFLMDDDEQNPTQEINLKLIANATGLRSDSCRTSIELLAEVKLIEAFWLKSLITSVQVSIPNFMKYFGRYEKTETMKCPNKRKEKENKEKNTKPLALEFDFETLYQKFPRKEGKTKGLISCRAQIKTQDDYDALNRAIDVYSKSPEVQRGFVKYFSTFMNCWRDYLEVSNGLSNEEIFRKLANGEMQ